MLNNNETFILKRGDIVYVDLNKTAFGTNQGGKRPCVVVANNICNKHSKSIQIVPITSNLNKKKMPTHIYVKKNNLNGLEKDSIILVEAIDLISTLQITDIWGRLSDKQMNEVDEKIKLQLALKDKPNKINERRILNRAKSLKELENYIDKQKNKSVDLLNILKSQVVDFRDYCEEYNIDCSQYYVSKFNTINIYLQRNIAA